MFPYLWLFMSKRAAVVTIKYNSGNMFKCVTGWDLFPPQMKTEVKLVICYVLCLQQPFLAWLFLFLKVISVYYQMDRESLCISFSR